jgi:DNA repair protein RecO (recombination protein O)
MSQRPYRAEGIILKRKNTGEADRIITVFTREYGKIRLIAKGIRKVKSRRAPYLEVFSRVILLIHTGKSLDGISEASAVVAYPALRKDLEKVSLAYFLCELVDVLLPEKQEHRDVYLLLSDALAALNAGSAPAIYAQSREFALSLLWALGFLPRDRTLAGLKLQAFIESITEKDLHTPAFVRKILSS